MPAQPARSVVIARPPASTTASATAEPTAPAAPVIRTTLSRRRPIEADYQTTDGGRPKSARSRQSSIMVLSVMVIVIVMIMIMVVMMIVPMVMHMGRRNIGTAFGVERRLDHDSLGAEARQQSLD